MGTNVTAAMVTMAQIDARLKTTGAESMNDMLGQIEHYFGDDPDVLAATAKLAGPHNEDPELLVHRLRALHSAVLKHSQDCFVDAETVLMHMKEYGTESLEQWLKKAVIAKSCCDWCERTVHTVRQLAGIRR